MTIIENFNKEETYGVSANTLVHGDCLEVMKKKVHFQIKQ